MSVTSRRFIWMPVLLTIVCAVSYMVPLPAALFPLHLERLSSVGAPAFVVFHRGLGGLTSDLPLRYSLQEVCSGVLLILLLLSWFSFVLLPFWSECRIFGLSLPVTRWIFAIGGLAITVWSWHYL
jgi:hypothetical protein